MFCFWLSPLNLRMIACLNIWGLDNARKADVCGAYNTISSPTRMLCKLGFSNQENKGYRESDEVVFCAVQMRFPKAPPPEALVGKEHLLNAHNMTLLDGEMVVDEDIVAGTQKRRFLAYDLMALNSKSFVHKPWKVRPPASGPLHHNSIGRLSTSSCGCLIERSSHACSIRCDGMYSVHVT